MSTPELLIDQTAGGVRLLTLNRPDSLNAMTLPLQHALVDELARAGADAGTRCVVLTGAGERAFCAGYDVHEMSEWSQDEMLVHMLEREELMWRIAACETPVVIALNGLAMGLGAILATLGDVRITADSAAWRFSSVERGGAQATWSLPELIGRGRAGELLLTGREVSAVEAEQIGLSNRTVPAGELISEAVRTAGLIAAHPAAATVAIKRLLRTGAGRGLEDRFIAENLSMRTELRPRPISEVFAGFLTSHDKPSSD